MWRCPRRGQAEQSEGHLRGLSRRKAAEVAARGALRRGRGQDLWAARLRGVLFFTLKTEPASRTLDGVPPASRDPPPSRQTAEENPEGRRPPTPQRQPPPPRATARVTCRVPNRVSLGAEGELLRPWRLTALPFNPL